MFKGPRFLLLALLALKAIHLTSAEASVAMAAKVNQPKAAEAVRQLSPGQDIRVQNQELPVSLGNPKTAEAVRELSFGQGIREDEVRDLSVGNLKAAEAVRQLLGVYIPTSTPRRLRFVPNDHQQF